MPYFKNNETNILFIHIPKTGGTSVDIYLSKKFDIPLNNKSLFLFLKPDLAKEYNIHINSSLQHMTMNTILKYSKIFNINFKKLKIMTIVRNPYDRIISDLFFYNLIDVNTTQEQTFEIIKEYISNSNLDNHNIPQYLFITNDQKKIFSNIIIMRTKTLTDNMHSLGFKDFNQHVNTNNNKINSDNYLNNDSIKLINTYYHYDFEILGYDKITNF
jgi:hypothetical protein